MNIRVGNGFDVHALVAGRPLIIGGVTVPYERGLEGHSDADVLLHAICDAILGAIGGRDIGTHFPDTDPQYRNADSRILLRSVWKDATEAGFALGNVDSTIIAQAPKLASHIPAMIANIAADLGVDLRADATQVNVKAKTTERLGFTGRAEGIAALATIVLVRR